MKSHSVSPYKLSYFLDFFGDFLAAFFFADALPALLPADLFPLKAASHPSEYF